MTDSNTFPYPTPPVRTASDQAFDTIRQKILNGELAPGSKLTRREMAEIAGTSVIPVIEAMIRLEQEGLVESKPLIGSRVVTLDEKRTRDLFALREAVEVQVARILAGTLTPEQEENCRTIAKQLDENLYTGTSKMSEDSLWKLHLKFHSGLAELTECPSLVAALRRVNLYDILRGVVTRNRARNLPKNWHMRLVDALMSGDADVAERVMRHHVRSSLEAEEAAEAE